MELLERKVVYFNRLQDMSWARPKQDDLVCYTSVKNTSTGLMSKREFLDDYKFTQYMYHTYPVFIHKRYKTLRNDDIWKKEGV